MSTEFIPFPESSLPPSNPQQNAGQPQGLTPEQQQQAIDQYRQRLLKAYPNSPLNQRQPVGGVAVPAHDTGYVHQTYKDETVLGDTTEGMVKPDFTEAAPYLVSPSVNDAEGISIGLPSGFLDYPFKDLFVAPLKGAHIAKLARAHAEKSLRITAEVIGTTLRTTHPDYVGKPLAHLLSIQDFYFVLYFHLQNSYATPSVTQRSSCVNPLHLKDVEDGKLDVSTLRITETIRIDRLKVKNLESNPSEEYAAVAGVPLGFYTVQDIIEFQEDPMFATDEAFRFMGRYAGHIKNGTSLRERIMLLDELAPRQLSAIKDYAKAIGDYGVDTRVTVTCKECSASRLTTVSLDAHAFLSN